VLLWCSDLAIENALQGWKIGENWGRSGRFLTPNERDLAFGVPVYGVKFHQNWLRIVTVREVTDRQTDAGDFIICPMLCYSNGTDNDHFMANFQEIAKVKEFRKSGSIWWSYFDMFGGGAFFAGHGVKQACRHWWSPLCSVTQRCSPRGSCLGSRLPRGSFSACLTLALRRRPSALAWLGLELSASALAWSHDFCLGLGWASWFLSRLGLVP